MSCNWPNVTLQEVTSRIGDGLHGTPKYDESGEYYFINGNNLSDGEIVITERTKRASKEEYEKHKKNLNDRTIIVSINGTLGNIAVYNGEKVFLGKSACYLNVNEDVDKFFIKYVLDSQIFQNYIHNLATGSTIKNASLKLMREFNFKLPPLNVQRSIAGVLKNLSDRIRLNNQINQTLEQMAQALFKSWFVDFEPVKAKVAALEAGGSEEDALLAAMQAISGTALFDADAFAASAAEQLARLRAERPEQYAELRATAELFPSAMQDSELGEIPTGWFAMPLYGTAEYVNGAAFNAENFSADRSGLPIIKIAELKQGISKGTKYTNSEVKERYRITDSDVLYSWSGSPETSLEAFKWFGGDGWLNQHIFKLNFTEGQNVHFTYFLLKQLKPVLVRTAQQKQTTGLGHITVADMKRIKVPYPELALLSDFSRIVGPLYERGSEAVKETSSLTKLRDTLLPRLLSGELAISVAETDLIEVEKAANV